MFCKNCGTQLSEGATQCEQCGFAVEQEKTKSDVKVDIKEMINKNRKSLSIVGAAVVVVFIIAVFLLTKKTTINLNDYVTIEFS